MMNSQSDLQLLHAYSDHRSEAAFAELVRRHLDQVYSAAVRLVRDPHLAEDVSQAVFVALSKNADRLTHHAALAGWLHRTAHHLAAQTVRTEVRRRAREHEAAAMNEPAAPESAALWDEIAPLLDDALAALGETERAAVMLRYFDHKAAAEMAEILGVSADAAQKRLSRAVEHLRGWFAKRGVVAGAEGIAFAMSAHAVQAAPAGLAAEIATAALAGAAGAAGAVGAVGAVTATGKTAAISGLQKGLIAAAVIVITGVGIYLAFQATHPEEPASASHTPPSTTAGRPRQRQRGNSLAESIARARAERPPVDRQQALASLKQRFMELKPRGNDAVPQQDALAKEAAQLLLSSEEAVELLRYLEQNEMRYSELSLRLAIARLFESPRAAEARELLVQLPDTTRWLSISGRDGKTGYPYREDWSDAAGRFCPAEEFEAFQAALNCPSCAQAALFGHNRTLMRTNPQDAVTSTLAALDAKVPSYLRTYSLRHLFEGDLPADVNFEKLADLLPAPVKTNPEDLHSTEDPTRQALPKLFEKWARSNPAAAAEYVLTNPDRCPPDLIGAITSAAINSGEAADCEWLRQLPEGLHFDVIATSAATRLALFNSTEARKLAARIADPHKRQQCLDSIARHEAAVLNGDDEG